MTIDLRGAMVARRGEAEDRLMTRTWLIPLVLLAAGCGATPLKDIRTVTSVRQMTSGRWGGRPPEGASVAAGGGIVVTTRGPAALDLARCQAHAHERRAAYIRCALPTLAQLGTSGE